MSNPLSREETLFHAALALPTPEGRADYLRQACASDEPLRQRVEALLRAAAAGGDFLEPPTAVATTTPTVRLTVPISEKPGDRIGHYKLLERLGEGGCGVVYMADQTEPIRRRVALKVVKLGMDTKDVIARFEAERQALALMDHPNIAKVFDAGATSTGRPYLVMELVRGISITDYCDQNNLATGTRLDGSDSTLRPRRALLQHPTLPGAELLSHEHEFQPARKRAESKSAGSGDPAHSDGALL